MWLSSYINKQPTQQCIISASFKIKCFSKQQHCITRSRKRNQEKILTKSIEEKLTLWQQILYNLFESLYQAKPLSCWKFLRQMDGGTQEGEKRGREKRGSWNRYWKGQERTEGQEIGQKYVAVGDGELGQKLESPSSREEVSRSQWR